jgi:exodeoxyribonuclease VII large subunit
VEALAERPALREPAAATRARRTHLAHLAARLAARSPVASLRRRAESLALLATRLGLPLARRLGRARDALADREDRAFRAAAAWAVRARHRVDVAASRLEALSPLAVLARGYSLTTGPDGRVLSRAAEAPVGTVVRTRLSEGRLESRVERQEGA